MSSGYLAVKAKDKYVSAYKKRMLKSLAILEEAKHFMPGGHTRAAIWFDPFPIWIDEAEGCRFRDLDGHEYIDFHNCYTTMILGHANPKVVAAVKEQIGKGTALGALTTDVVRLAKLLCGRVESVNKIRFANSGTEAVMAALQVARAFTGKNMIIKTEDCYHGTYDPVVSPSDSPGISKSAQAESIVIPYNDELSAKNAIIANKGKLAAVIIEGAMGNAGMIPPKNGYLKFLREITRENNILLILDEIITLRLALGGMQSICDIKPDLTTMGKIIGGGYAVGAFGGSEDVMQMVAPPKHKVRHSGTTTANPVTACAGVATLEQLTADEIKRINELGESFAQAIRAIFDKLHIKGQVTGIGSVQNIHFSDKPVTDGRSARAANKELLYLFFLAMLERGIFIPSRGLYSISTPMTQKEIDAAVKAVEDAMIELKPVIKESWPELIESVC